MNRCLWILGLLLMACPDGEKADAGASQTDAARPDLGPAPFDAGFLGTLGSICSQTADCLDHQQRCYVGSANGSRPRCTVDCNDLEDCVAFSAGATLSLDDVDCNRPANSSGSRKYCVESPGRGGGPDLDAGSEDVPAGSDGGADVGPIDAGPQPDLGPGQVSGTFCSRTEHCRSQLCLAGVVGEERCADRCQSREDCADFAAIAQLEMDRVDCLENPNGGSNYCGEVRLVPGIGWNADLVTRLHNVSGRVRIEEIPGGEGTRLNFRQFNYDGSANGLDVVLALSLGDPEGAAERGELIVVRGQMTCRIRGCPDDHPCLPNGNCNGAQFTVPLPALVEFSDFDHVSVFDRAAGANGTAFATGEFLPPQN